MKKRTFFLALLVSAAFGWSANDLLTPWNIRTQSALFAWGETLKAMNGVGRDGNLNGNSELFEARGDCLPRAELARLAIYDSEISAIYRCQEIIAGLDVIGELVVRIDKDDFLSGHAVGFLPAADDPGMGAIARLGPN